MTRDSEALSREVIIKEIDEGNIRFIKEMKVSRVISELAKVIIRRTYRRNIIHELCRQSCKDSNYVADE